MTTTRDIIEAGLEELGADGLCFANGEPIGILEKLRDSEGFTIQDFLHARPAWIIQPNNWFVLPDGWISTTAFHPSFRHKTGAYVKKMNGSWSYDIPGQKKLYIKRIRPTAPECFRVVQEWIEKLTDRNTTQGAVGSDTQGGK